MKPKSFFYERTLNFESFLQKKKKKTFDFVKELNMSATFNT